MRPVLIIAGLFLGTVGATIAQTPMPMPMPPGPHIILAPPPGTPPPDVVMSTDPEEAKNQFFDIFTEMMDTNKDGVLSKDELRAWVAGIMMHPPGAMPPPGMMPPYPMTGDTTMYHEGMMPPPDSTMMHSEGMMHPMNVPPECSAELVNNEMLPQAENVPCGASSGNLLFRTVCNMPGFDSQAISLPDGRDADCFRIEAQTANKIVFTIYPESDPANIIYDTRRDGLHNIGTVHLGDTGVYRIDLDEGESDPGARVTVAFVDHPE